MFTFNYYKYLLTDLWYRRPDKMNTTNADKSVNVKGTKKNSKK